MIVMSMSSASFFCALTEKITAQAQIGGPEPKPIVHRLPLSLSSLFLSLSLPSPHVASISRSLSCDSPSLVIVVWATGFDVLPFIMDQFCLEGTKRIECRMQKCSLVAVRYSLVIVLVQQLVPMNVLPQHCRRRRRTKQAFASSIHVFGDL